MDALLLCGCGAVVRLGEKGKFEGLWGGGVVEVEDEGFFFFFFLNCTSRGTCVHSGTPGPEAPGT